MFGKLISGAIKVVTLPIDVVESVADAAIGGDGSKESKRMNDNPLSEIRDSVCKSVEEIDN